RQRRREQQRERLARATEELLTSEGWRRWLRARATFHSYSLRNQARKPATCVAVNPRSSACWAITTAACARASAACGSSPR
ncbi:MAG: hypothetical protein M3Q43_01040, partial [Actinomycetota bacterium]|nr:hypothetical protein [Actinomycetota bacterium]